MYLYGKNTCLSVLESNEEIFEIYLTKNFKDQKIIDLLNKQKRKIKYVSSDYLDKLCNTNYHQGIVISVKDYEYADFEQVLRKEQANENSLFLLLDGLEDPQNFGSIIRTSEVLAISGIIIPKNRSVKVTPTVARVSTGAIENIDIMQVTNLRQTINTLKENGYWIVGADMHTDLLYDQVDYKMKVALIIGSEGKGISNLLKKECDFIVKLPMYGKTSSLNAAVSAAILMYQINSNRKR